MYAFSVLRAIIYNLRVPWNTKVRDILGNLGTDFYFYDPLRSNLTTLRDLASHSNGIYRNDIIWFQNMTRAEQASRLRYPSLCIKNL